MTAGLHNNIQSFFFQGVFHGVEERQSRYVGVCEQHHALHSEHTPCCTPTFLQPRTARAYHTFSAHVQQLNEVALRNVVVTYAAARTCLSSVLHMFVIGAKGLASRTTPQTRSRQCYSCIANALHDDVMFIPAVRRVRSVHGWCPPAHTHAKVLSEQYQTHKHSHTRQVPSEPNT